MSSSPKRVAEEPSEETRGKDEFNAVVKESREMGQKAAEMFEQKTKEFESLETPTADAFYDLCHMHAKLGSNDYELCDVLKNALPRFSCEELKHLQEIADDDETNSINDALNLSLEGVVSRSAGKLTREQLEVLKGYVSVEEGIWHHLGRTKDVSWPLFLDIMELVRKHGSSE